uniref:Mortality factor 4-like protein 1 n=1 Tax=Vombatus ursinus TaxID=29139 RepID=A0A4X2L6F6_VOMUR
MAPKQPPKPEFQEGERVLCFHGPLLYEAKCLQVATEGNQVRYLIHYSGWNKNWDEWVPENRVLKYSEANVQKQRDLQRANQEQKSKQKTGTEEGSSGGASTSTARGAPQPHQRRRTRRHPSAKDSGTSATRAEAQVQIPVELKPLLVQDRDLVTKQRQLFSLPAKKNVDSILEEYAASKKARGEGDNTEYAAEEMVGGIRAHFNVLLGTQLLYEFERPQYVEILASHPGVPMSQLYGAPHLLRLFVRIGAMLAHSPFDEKSLASLFSYLHDFLKYLAKNPSAFFNASEYKGAPPEYNQKVA